MTGLLLAILLLCAGAAAAAPAILVYGDSLSAAYGIPQSASWVNLLGERLKRARLNYTLVNASISGETSAGGATRIRAALDHFHPAVVILELGVNDGLRGLPVARMKENLAAIIRAAKEKHARVLLVGMRLPPNYGSKYTEAFERAYSELARQEKVALVPFMLQGVSGGREMFQEDHLHPTAEAQGAILETVWKALRPLLR